jgi:hypothetical protein
MSRLRDPDRRSRVSRPVVYSPIEFTCFVSIDLLPTLTSPPIPISA